MFDDDENEDFYDGDLENDIERFEKYFNGGEPGYMDTDQLEAVIDHYLITGQYNKANQCADYSLNIYPYSDLFQLRKAQSLSALGELKEALNILSKIEKKDSASVELKLTKASIFSQLRDPSSAIKYFKEALSLCEPEDKDEIFLDLAMEYENKNDFKNAISVLKEAIQNNPKNEGAIYEMAFCYDQLGEYDNAIKSYSDFIDENPYSFTAWYNLGNSYSKSENYDKAIWAYDYCILINENFGPVYFNLANAYLSQEKYELAIENFNKTIEVEGEDPIALCYIGECYEQLGELKLAKSYYQQSLDLSPHLADAWLGMGIVEDLEGNTRHALTFLHKAADIDPENAGIYSVLGGAYEKLEDFEKAQEYYLLSLELEPNDQECLIAYINMLTELSLKDSLDILEQFMKSNPENDIAEILKINLIWKLGRKEEAVQLFSELFYLNKELAMELFETFPEYKTNNAFLNITNGEV